MPVNQAQIDFWNGRIGQEWTELQDRMDTNLSAIHAALMPFAAPSPVRSCWTLAAAMAPPAWRWPSGGAAEAG